MADEEKKDIDLENNADDEADISEESKNDDQADDSSDEEKDKPEYTEREKKLFARAKKAEGELKKLKSTAPPQKKPDPPADTTQADTATFQAETRLIARGYSDELIAEAKDIAKGKGISLDEAVKTKNFQLLEKEAKEKEKREKAKLPASSGSGGTENIAEQFPSGQKREDHKKAFDKAVGKK